MIELYHVYKYYEDTPALEDINFTVEKGDMTLITGPSGAGKTTVLKLIFMEEPPSRGQIFFGSQAITSLKRHQIPYFRRQMGFIFQDFRLLQDVPVFDNLALVLEAYGFKRKHIMERVREVLKEVGLMHKIGVLVKKLSAGEQQRVAIARAIIGNPSLILADEPTGNLDPVLTHQIMRLFQTLNFKGTTIIMATHDYMLVEKYGRRVIHLEEGKVVKG